MAALCALATCGPARATERFSTCMGGQAKRSRPGSSAEQLCRGGEGAICSGRAAGARSLRRGRARRGGARLRDAQPLRCRRPWACSRVRRSRGYHPEALQGEAHVARERRESEGAVGGSAGHPTPQASGRPSLLPSPPSPNTPPPLRSRRRTEPNRTAEPPPPRRALTLPPVGRVLQLQQQDLVVAGAQHRAGDVQRHLCVESPGEGRRGGGGHEASRQRGAACNTGPGTCSVVCAKGGAGGEGEAVCVWVGWGGGGGGRHGEGDQGRPVSSAPTKQGGEAEAARRGGVTR
mgnify:CR=1 FL=1